MIEIIRRYHYIPKYNQNPLQQLCRRLGVRISDQYEKGERTPSYQTVSFMAHFFNPSTDYLYGLSNDTSPSSITIHSSDAPDLFLLVQTVQANKDITSRLLAYANRLKELKQ